MWSYKWQGAWCWTWDGIASFSLGIAIWAFGCTSHSPMSRTTLRISAMIRARTASPTATSSTRPYFGSIARTLVGCGCRYLSRRYRRRSGGWRRNTQFYSSHICVHRNSIGNRHHRRPALGGANHVTVAVIYTFICPRRIDTINRIVLDVGIHVHAIFVTNRVGLHEPAERGRVNAGLVVVHSQFRDPSLSGVAESSLSSNIIARRCVGYTELVVTVCRQRIPGAVGHSDDRAALVGEEITLVARSDVGPFEPDQRVVASGGAMNIAANCRTR